MPARKASCVEKERHGAFATKPIRGTLGVCCAVAPRAAKAKAQKPTHNNVEQRNERRSCIGRIINLPSANPTRRCALADVPERVEQERRFQCKEHSRRMRVRRGSVQQITLCFDGRTYLKSVHNNKRIVSESSEFLRSARPSCV